MTLTREQLLSFADEAREVVPVTLPGDRGIVHIGRMKACERDAWMKSNVAKDRDGELVPVPGGSAARLLCFTICDATGKRLFDLGDADVIGRWPIHLLRPLEVESLRFNLLGRFDVEQAEKNSEPAPTDSSPSDSPATSE